MWGFLRISPGRTLAGLCVFVGRLLLQRLTEKGAERKDSAVPIPSLVRVIPACTSLTRVDFSVRHGWLCRYCPRDA
jgi:hypothetical protein